MKAFTLVPLVVGAALAQFVPPPAPVILNATKSGVLPVLPPAFTGVETLEGAIIHKAPVNISATPVNGPAQVQSNLPMATFTAQLPSVAFNELTGTVVSGSVVASSMQGSTGTMFVISFSNLPNFSQYGPFIYHVHNMPVPSDGNCTSTLGHFDYTNFGEYYTCDTSNPQNCQIGDLAGKHGMIMSSPNFTTQYVDDYLSTDPSSPYYFGQKSIVIHSGNTTRLTCANFTMGEASSVPSGTATTSMPVASFTGGAGSAQTVAAGLVVGAAGLFAWAL